MKRYTRPVLVTAVLLILGGAGLGVAMGGHGSPVANAAAGALVGASVTLGAIAHLVARTADGRGIAATRPESEQDSVERQVWLEASSRTFADAIGIFALVALVSMWTSSESLARWLPAAGVVVVGLDLAVRARRSWHARMPRDA